MELKIYSQSGILKTTVSPDDNSVQKKSVMGENTVNVSFTLSEAVLFDVNDYIDFAGERYTLPASVRPTQKSTLEFEYSLQFSGIESELSKALCFLLLDGEMDSDFALTEGPEAHMQLIVDNINRIKKTTVWRLGTIISAENKVITYEGTDCLSALNQIAQTFETEWWIEGTTIYLCKCEHGETIELGYGGDGSGVTGLTELRKQNGENTDFFTRLYAKGSTRNIKKSSYGSDNLHLPSPLKYLEKNTEYGVIEREVIFEKVYPRRVGTITEVRSAEQTTDGKTITVYYFKDNGLNFNPNDYEIESLTKHIKFETGELSGYDFEANYNATTGEFELINQYPGEDVQLPGGAMIPAVGNTYVLYNVRMPEEYIPLAEKELQQVATDYLDKFSIDGSIYSGDSDPIDFEERGISVSLGRRIKLHSDVYFTAGYRNSRITGFTRNLNNPQQITLDISDAVSVGRLEALERKVNAILPEVRKGSTFEIIESNDLTPETDQNVYSAARAKLEDEKRLRKDVPDLAREHITFAKGLTVTGGATVDSLKVTGLAEAKTLNVTETATTMDLIVKNLAETYDLNVSHVATLFRTIIKDYISSELFIPGFTGSGTKLYQALNGDWNLELDNLTVRKVMNVFELIINKIRSVNGAMVISQSNGKVESVTNLGEFYQLGINEEYPTFQPGDLVRCQRFTGRGIKYYWVTVSRLEGSDIVVAKSEFDSLPEIGDELVQMGNVSNLNRQSLIYLSAAEDGRPVIDILNGVNSKSFAGKLMSRFGCLDNITDTDFPSDYQPSGYGLYSVNCFLKGIFVLRNGKTVEGALTELGSMYSSLQTELSAVPGQITLAVREGVENVQIGGVNMFDDSATERHNVGECCEYYELTNATTIFDKHGIGKYTISFDCKADKAGLLELYCCPGVISDFKYMWQEVTFQFNATTIYQRFSFTFTVYLNNHKSSWSPISLYGVYGSGVAPWIKNIKLEQGTKATTWSPSPHDTSIDAQEKAEKAQIAAQDYAETQVYLAKIEANAYADGVVDEEEARAIAEARAKLEEAKNHANEAARAAQDAAAIDASNKDQIVKSELNSSIEVLRGRIELKVDQADFNNLGERLSSAESKIILNADSISQTVTKTEFNSLELGGRNLCIGGTGIFYADRFFNLPTRNILSPYITADGAGREIVVSFDIKVSISRLINVYPYQSSGISIANSFDITPPAGEWKRYNFKTKIYKYADIPGYTDGSIGIYDYAGPQNFQIRFFKIELGNKATDWSPAPEDLENDAQTKADAAQQAAIADALAKYPTKTTFETSIQQLSNSISFKASQTSVNGIESRLSAAEIKIEPTQINFTVKQQVDTAKDAAIADTTGKINNIQVGGVNLLENTEKERNIGLEYAGIDITSVAKANLGKYLSCSVEVYIPTGGTVRFYSLGGYSLGFDSGPYVEANTWTRIYDIGIIRYSSGDPNGDCCTLSIYTGYGSGKYISWRKLKVEQGNKPTSWSPAVKEMASKAELLDTGINISDKKIVMTADNTKIQDNSGNQIALFTTIGGKPKLIAENIDVANLGVKKLDAATGSFKRLNCVDDNGNIVGGVSFGTDGKMWFEGDLYSQGYDYSKDRGFRFYSSDIWCRGGLGSNYHNTLITYGNTGYFCTRGIRTDRKGYVYTVFSSSVDSAGNTYYKLPLLGTSGDAAGFPVDLVVMASGGARYELEGSPGKSIIVANANDRSTVWIYTNGYHIQVDGGAVAQFVNVGSWLLTPAVASNIIGKGWLYYGLTDNNWS